MQQETRTRKSYLTIQPGRERHNRQTYQPFEGSLFMRPVIQFLKSILVCLSAKSILCNNKGKLYQKT